MSESIFSSLRRAGRFGLPARACLVLGLSGCAPEWPADLPGAFQPVTGAVTLEGMPIEHVHVSFVPLQEGGVIGSGETDEQGRYRLSYTSVAGAVMGQYKVILSYRTDPKGVPISKAMDSSLLVPLEVSQAIERLPGEYSSERSTLKATVKQGDNVIDFALRGQLKPIVTERN